MMTTNCESKVNLLCSLLQTGFSNIKVTNRHKKATIPPREEFVAFLNYSSYTLFNKFISYLGVPILKVRKRTLRNFNFHKQLISFNNL